MIKTESASSSVVPLTANVNCEQESGVEMSVDSKPVTASKVYRAGEEVIKEFPLLYITKDQENGAKCIEAEKATGIHRRVWAVYFQYSTLGDETKAQIRSLFSMNASQKAESFRDLLNGSEYRDKVDVNEFLSITMIFNFNAIEERVEGSASPRDGTGIYATASRFTHSCEPNCIWSSAGDGWCTVRAIRSIGVGEIMTFNFYDADFVLQPTALRRAYLLRSKEMLCECARCSSPGDDTRQFSCADEACTGRCYVNQPSIDSNLLMLPCTVCGTSPTQEFQKLMFYREKSQAAVVKSVLEEIRIFPAKLPGGQVTPTALELQEMEFLSPHHYLTHYLAKIKQVSHEAVGDKVLAAMMSAAAARAAEDVLKFPSPLLTKAWLAAGKAHEEVDSTATLVTAKTYFQKALQMARVLFDETTCRQRFYAPLIRVLGKRSAAVMSGDTVGADGCVKIKQCTFCGSKPSAGPVGVAVSLRRCAGCKKVAYCTINCQRAHWAGHQPVCIKPVSTAPVPAVAPIDGVEVK